MQSSQISSRLQTLQRFAESALGRSVESPQVASADASFRSYWRVASVGESWIVMDAPPAKEDITAWLEISRRLSAASLHVPAVIAVDAAQGFILMEDLGDRLYLPALNDASADALYADALSALLRMQTQVSAENLPVFDAPFITVELELMPTWFLQRHLGMTPTCDAWDVMELAFRHLINALRAQPQIFMHRDLHSRNLMIVAGNNPGVIDFQGAMLGPIGYDLASLLRDCYIAWPPERVDSWVAEYRLRLVQCGLIDADSSTFRRWFDLAGLQRHVKVLGIFCRLCYRDGKHAYLADLPLVVRYVLEVAERYPEFVDFAALLRGATSGRDLTQLTVDSPRP